MTPEQILNVAKSNAQFAIDSNEYASADHAASAYLVNAIDTIARRGCTGQDIVDLQSCYRWKINNDRYTDDEILRIVFGNCLNEKPVKKIENRFADLDQSSFVDIKVAIGYLVMVGIDCHYQAEVLKDGHHTRACIAITTTGIDSIGLFRDGTTWKASSDKVQDAIEQHSRS